MKQWNEFPVEIQERMLECQVEQGNKRDASVFEKKIDADACSGGFDWVETEENYYFWYLIIHEGDYKGFYKLYPKQPFIPELYEGVPMEVSDHEGFERSEVLPVICKVKGWYITMSKENVLNIWYYARPIQPKVPTYTKEELVKIIGHEFNIKEE